MAQSRLSSYWQLQIPGLSLSFVLGLLFCQGFYGNSLKALVMAVWSVLVVGVVLEVLHLGYRKLAARGLATSRLIVHVLARCVPATLTTNVLTTALDPLLPSDIPGGITWRGVVSGTTATWLYYTMWSALYFGLKHRDAASSAQAQLREAQGLATQAELAMLRYQLNPHFLFNSLTSLRAQISDSPEKARAMTTELAGYLRYVLRESARHSVLLGEELEGTKRYLSLEKIRFEEKLEVRVEVASGAASTVVPSFLLQPLVENAIKYGQTPLVIAINAELEQRVLKLSVSNTGAWVSPREGGIGLANLRKRLEALFPGRHVLDAGPGEAGWVRVRIELPVEQESVS